MRKLIFAMLLAMGLAAGLMSPASAAGTRASIISDGLRVDVTFTGKKPTKATLVVGGASYKLKRSGKKWTTKQLTAAQVAALIGQKARVKITLGGKKRTVRGTVAGSGPTTPVSPTAPVIPAPPPAPAPLFTAPGADSTGDAAYQAIKGYFANSTLTDCPAGWPNCSVEERYGIFENGTQWYCRLTPTSQSDIRSVSNIIQILGAEQKADGSWGVSYRVDSYGNLHHYSVRVAANGSASVQWWGSGVDPAGPPSEVKTGLQWMRGAKDCSY